MKTYIKSILTIGIGLSFFSCKKSTYPFSPSGSINVTDAVINNETLNIFNSDQTVGFNSNTVVPVLAGQNQLHIYDMATSPITSYYNNSLNVVNAGNYSLFLAGTSSAQVDAILITETYKTYADGVCGVRFINLSPDSKPISVDIQGNPNGSEVSSLSYKAFTTFKQHPANLVAQNNGYNFEIRDAATGDLITTYSLTPVSFRT